MARPERNNVDYFPHLIGGGKKMTFIESKHGNDGYATWFKILESLAGADFHFLNLNDELELMFLSGKCKVLPEKMLEIIEDLVKLKVFNKIAWEHKVLWSDTFIEHIKDAYLRRNNKCITFEGLCNHLLSLGIHLVDSNTTRSYSNTQSKVKQSKGIKTPVETTEDIDFGKFISKFNSFADRQFRVNEKIKSALKSRLQDYSKDEIIIAVKQAHLDSYHIETKFKYLTPEFILRPEKLEKFLNAPNASGPQGYTPQVPN